jgi:hypothetical protein
MLKKVLLGFTVCLILVIGGFVLYISTRPDTFVVQRSTEIKSTPAAIYPFIADFHQWANWSPYEHLDPKMEKSYDGKESGLGAKYNWEGNEKVGAGKMEIIEAAPPSKVAIRLDFSKPFEGHDVAEFTLVPKGEETSVTWSMRGPSSFMMKFAGMFMNMDEMLGKDFESGLENLKNLAEKKDSKGEESKPSSN